jgi:putative hydrolase of the HAD superfamily
MKQHLFFDLDDTLVHCNIYFHEVLNEFAARMCETFASSGLTREAVLAKQSEIDIAGVRIHGFKSDHFPQSLVDTYRHFCGRFGESPSAEEERSLWRLGLSVYERDVEPYPHMEETLESLAAQGHVLHLYTGGDAFVQRRKIRRLRLERYFDRRVYIRTHKRLDDLRAILAEVGCDPAHTWMIGNSVRTDVLPALACGLNVLYMKRPNEWVYNVLPIDVPPRGVFLTLQSLADIPPVIRRHAEAAGAGS